MTLQQLAPSVGLSCRETQLRHAHTTGQTSMSVRMRLSAPPSSPATPARHGSSCSRAVSVETGASGKPPNAHQVPLIIQHTGPSVYHIHTCPESHKRERERVERRRERQAGAPIIIRNQLELSLSIRGMATTGPGSARRTPRAQLAGVNPACPVAMSRFENKQLPPLQVGSAPQQSCQMN